MTNVSMLPTAESNILVQYCFVGAIRHLRPVQAVIIRITTVHENRNVLMISLQTTTKLYQYSYNNEIEM